MKLKYLCLLSVAGIFFGCEGFTNATNGIVAGFALASLITNSILFLYILLCIYAEVYYDL